MSERWISELTDQGARFADGRIAGFGDSPAELAALDTQPVICDLSHDGLILVSGEDAAAFLHAQLCNDVQALSEGQAHWNGWCSPKGRLLATFLLWRGRQGYFLQLPRTLQAAIQKRLQMFVLRSKVTLADVSGDWVRFGIGGHDADALLTEVLGEVPAMPMATVHTRDGRLIRMSPQRFEFVAAADDALKLWRQLTPRAKPVGALVWDALAIRDGVLTVVPATQDAFVPQMANFELIGGLSFKKGCYPGQEIVARTQYRGILKRRLARVHIDAPSVNVGDSLFSAEFGDQAAGTVAAAAPSSKGGFDALVVAQIEGLKTNSLRLGALDGPAAAIQPLPYAVPEIS